MELNESPNYNMSHLVFGWIDYLLFGSLLIISILIGIYFGCFSKQDSAGEYLYGGKKMGYVPVAFSILARFVTFFSCSSTLSITKNCCLKKL